MKKRWLGILLTIGMVLTLLPTAAWAEGETEPVTKVVSTAEELTAALADSANDVVKLMEDITITKSLTVSRTVTLDLNDHVLTITGEDSFITVTGKNIKLTLTDSATTQTERRFSINQDGAWVPDENGNKTVTGGVITGGKAHVDEDYGFLVVDSGVCIKERGTLTVTNVTLNAPVENVSGTIAGSGTFNSTVINEDKLTGGTFNGPVANYKGGRQEDNKISGGTFYGTVANGYNYNNPGKGEEPLDGKRQGLITGGTFYGKVTNAFQSTISGGSFYGEVDNRDRSEYLSNYLGILAGGTFYAGHPGTVADGCCTVTYEYPFEEAYAIQIVKKGETATRPADPVRSDFNFDNWYAYPYPDEPEQRAYSFDKPVNGNMSLYGNWANTFYGIHITDKSGNVYHVTDKNADDVLSDGTVVYTPGYASENTSYDDWKKALSGETVEGLQLPKLTLNGANLQQIKVDVTWISNQNVKLFSMMLQLELVGNNTVEYNGDSGAAISADYLVITGSGSLNVTAQGQNAKAIAVESMGGGYYQYGGDVTLYGTYSGIHCSEAYFEFAAGKLTASSSKSALYCDLSENRFKITSGMTTFFCGTSEDAAFKIQQPFDSTNIYKQLQEQKCHFTPVGESYQAILYAQLISNHTVTFDTDGGSAVDAQKVAYGGKATAPAAPTKSGYTFAGWYLADGTKYDFSTPVTANLTLTAHWTRNSSGGGGGTTYYTLTFDTNGGSALSALRLARGSTVDLARYVPERSGHVFTGWYADAALTQPIERVTLSASTTVYAGWRAETNDLPFTDVGADGWFRDDVQYVYDKGLMTGTTADRFAPNEGMTRAMLVTVLWRQAGSPVVNYAMDFSDVAEGAWYAEAVRWAAAEGVVGGYGDGRFGPNDPITREQLATILFRHLVGDGAAELADWLRPYADADQIGAYAAPAMQWAVGHGVLKGDGDRLDPQGTATRAQVAAVLHRALAL